MNDVIAVPSLANDDVAGAICFWRLSGTIDFEDLEASWGTLDKKLLPNLPSPLVALKRALKDVADNDSRVTTVRPLRGEHKGFVLVHETYDRDRPTYTNGLEAELVGEEDELVVRAMNTQDQAHVVTLGVRFAQHRLTITQQDISSWLVWLVKGVQAVCLRDTGGIYYVPRPMLDTWRAYVGAIRSCSSSKLFEIAAVRSNEAVAAVLDALQREAEETVADMELAISEAITSGEGMSTKGRNAKTRDAKKLEEKLQTYEQLLGVSLPLVHQRLEEIQHRLTVALLVPESA